MEEFSECCDHGCHPQAELGGAPKNTVPRKAHVECGSAASARGKMSEAGFAEWENVQNAVTTGATLKRSLGVD